MKRIVHLSDLHFGHLEASVTEPLIRTILDLRPDVTVVSGDLTQDARDEQFREARAFLDSLPAPRVIVPGNHDLPFFSIFRRFWQNLRGYKRWITGDLEPFFYDREIAILGINTARVWPIRGGRINKRQVERVQERMKSVTPGTTRVLVTHHPFDLELSFSKRHLVGRARAAMTRLASCVDLLLAGHMHIGHAGYTTARYRLDGDSSIFVQAGTATSRWIRGEPNSFNLIRANYQRIEVERFTHSAGAESFAAVATDRFVRGPEGWSRAPEEPLTIADEQFTGLLRHGRAA